MNAVTVVGAGRVGSVFVRVAREAGLVCAVATRADPTPLAAPPAGPILVCTRADDLEGVIAATPPERRADLVFLQNGMIVPLLRAHGLEGNTQGLLYFAATRRDGVAEPGAPSLFFGPYASWLVGLLGRAGIPARALADRDELAREIAVKLAWNAIFGLLGQRFDEPVGETVTRHRAEVAALAAELLPVLEAELGVHLPVPPLVDRMCAYSESIPTFRGAVRELRWRNGYLRDAARVQGRATPLHDTLLAAVGA